MMKRILVVLVMLLVLAGLIWFGFFRHSSGSARDQAGRTVPVVVEKARTTDVPVVLHGVGTVQAYQTVTVKPQVNGKLLSLNFEEGQEVKKGDVLAQIDPVTYKADLEEAKAKLAMDKASLANARQDLARYAKLAKTNYVSKQQADQARATVRQDAAQVQSDEAAVDSAQATLGYTSVVAPISGRTGIRMVDEGNILSTGDTDGIVTITQTQPIAAVFTLPSDEIQQIRAADAKAPLAVRVTGANSDAVLDTGKLEVINNQVDTTTGTIKLKATLPNASEQLWPGQFVNVKLTVGTLDQATVVPVAAVQQGPNGAFVYGIDNAGKAQMQSVQVTQQNETEAVIAQGIKPGQRVITAGFGQLSDGAKVRVSAPEGATDTADADHGDTQDAKPRLGAGASRDTASESQPKDTTASD